MPIRRDISTVQINEFGMARCWVRFDLWAQLGTGAHRGGLIKNAELRAGYCLILTGGPLTRIAFRESVTATRSAILMKGMPLFIP